MEDWIHINTNDVISIFEKAKTGFPWGNYPNEKYRCLIFWYKNRINMTVMLGVLALDKLQLNKIAARWPAKAVAQLSFSQ